MKFYPIVLFTLVVTSSLLLIGASADESAGGSDDKLALARGSNVPRFFEFDKFVQLYNKHYASFVERLNRMRLFMAKATVIFHRGVQYIHREVGHYLAFNDKSDWTDDERARLYPDTIGSSSIVTIKSRAEVEKIIDQLVGDKEVEQPEIRHKRRAVADEQELAPKRHLAFDQLLRDPREVKATVSPKLVTSVPSNNPDYEEPEQMSEGVDDDELHIEPPLTESDVAKIPPENSKLFSDVINSFNTLWFGSTQKGEQKVTKHEKPLVVDLSSAKETKVYLDYRDTDCVAPVKDQRGCGSCYAFSSMAVFEYLYCKQTGKLVLFSEQFLVDCGTKFEMKQCNGGRINEVDSFVRTVGLELASYYPYRARSNTCPYDESDNPAQMGHTKVKNGHIINLNLPFMYADQIVRLLNVHGPLVFGIRVNQEFADYGGGVHRIREPNLRTGHGMTLVGHGIEEGEEYWLLRNSHGIGWGEKGYYKLSKEHVDPNALLFVSYINGQFDENKLHKKDKVIKNVLKNRNFVERLFNL